MFTNYTYVYIISHPTKPMLCSSEKFFHYDNVDKISQSKAKHLTDKERMHAVLHKWVSEKHLIQNTSVLFMDENVETTSYGLMVVCLVRVTAYMLMLHCSHR